MFARKTPPYVGSGRVRSASPDSPVDFLSDFRNRRKAPLIKRTQQNGRNSANPRLHSASCFAAKWVNLLVGVLGAAHPSTTSTDEHEEGEEGAERE